MELRIDSLCDDDRAQRVALARQAFGGTRGHDPEAPDFPADQVVAAYRGDDLVGTVSTHHFTMSWAGDAVTCGGVGGVLVAPEARGNDTARRMMRESFERMRQRGEVISSLYPTTAALYRSLGYEFVGWWRNSVVDLDELPVDDGSVEWRRVEFQDPSLLGPYRSLAAGHDGWLVDRDGYWDYRMHLAAGADDNAFAYVGTLAGREVASVLYRYAPTTMSSRMFDINVELIGARDDAAVRAALGFVRRNDTVAGRMSTTLPTDLLWHHVEHAQRIETIKQWAWMLRIVDLAPAIAARGWPAGVTGSVPFEVIDPVLEDQSGPGVFAIADGAARWEPGGEGRVTITIQDLAALYGGRNPRQLAGAGRLPGATEADLGLLQAAFAADPTAIDFY